MLVHGMIIQGDPKDLHYGIAIRGTPSQEYMEEVKRKAKRMAILLKKVYARAN